MQYNNIFKLGTSGRVRGVTLFDIDLIDWLIFINLWKEIYEI